MSPTRPSVSSEETSQGKVESPTPSVSVVNLQGAIGCSAPLNIHTCREVIDEAFQGPNLEAVILNINSCGGSLTQSHLVSSYIKEKATRLDIPVISFVEDEAVSCGYWLACSAQQIFACRTSNIGGETRAESGTYSQHKVGGRKFAILRGIKNLT